MFRQRTSSAKPGDDLLATFREQFPQVSAGTSTAAPGPANTITTALHNVPVTTTGPDRPQSIIGHDAFRDQDQDPTPRASAEPWRFTPSMLEGLNSFSFANSLNQGTGYYTPTPGGTNTLYHPQAGDLHTPSLGLHMGLGTPLSMPTTEGGLHAATASSSFQHGFQTAHHFQQYNPFIQPPQHQPSFAPSSFVHHDTSYETMDQDGSPLSSEPADDRLGSIDHAFQGQSPLVPFHPGHLALPMVPLPESAEKFRFHATLNAPTAMIKRADEIPVTYLNKGQAYSLAVADTMPSVTIRPGTRFRTFVRVSFEDEQQRQRPGMCWSLWKEGRGTSEAHQRGGKLQAVEFVEAGQPAEGDDKRTRMELESASFDGFSVIWTPGVHGAVECNIAVRFNFLSTDFSHSKGVKGIPVRLCAKTQALDPSEAAAATQLSPPESSGAPHHITSETCYCKVKLFRDHGAERKLANDIQHVRKTIEKLKQQIAQAESGLKDSGKRKRGGTMKAQDSIQKAGKAPKHKRTWSISSVSSAGAVGGNGNGRPQLEEDLQVKLHTLQDMFTSTRPVSVLYLRGEELDDPDLHPVSLPGDSSQSMEFLTKVESRDSNAWRSERGSIADSALVSPSPSSLSLPSQPSGGAASNAQGPWQQGFSPRTGAGEHALSRSPQAPTKIQRRDDAGNLTGWIEALGVDSAYRPPPPPDRNTKPVACFYIARRSPMSAATAVPSPPAGGQELHRAVYLRQRTVRDFVARVAAKFRFDAGKVARVSLAMLRRGGLQVEVDDDVIQDLPEGQDMLLDMVEVPAQMLQKGGAAKREWDMMAVDNEADALGEPDATPSSLSLSPISMPAVGGGGQAAYEMRLTF